MSTVISVENLNKTYHLGQIGTGTFTNDLKVWWAKTRGKPNPLLRIGETDFGNQVGDNLWALKDVTFKVEQGEVLGIIGRNGAGKSTLLKILSRVTAPSSGVVKVKGRIASLLEVGTGFHPELTGRENIYLNGAILGMSRKEIDNKFDEIVDFSEVEKFIDTPVKRYSSGMYVRLAFAVAAHLDPEILVVDEVLAVGDADFQKKCLGKMGAVSKDGRTVLFVSHNMTSISALCVRALLLKKGKIQFNADTYSVISAYHGDNQNLEKRVMEFDSKNSHKPTIIRACPVNESGNPISNIDMGKPFGIQVEYSNPIKVSDLVLGIRINTSLGTTVLGVNNLIQSSGFYLKPVSKGVIRVIFPEPCLNYGIYYVTLTLGNLKEDFFRVSDALKITVNSFDVYGTGKLPTPSQSLIVTSGIWNYLPSDEVSW